jgi:hypothetical protein
MCVCPIAHGQSRGAISNRVHRSRKDSNWAFPSGILIQPYRAADARQSAATERIGGLRVDRTRGTELAIVASLDVSATREGLLSRLG